MSQFTPVDSAQTYCRLINQRCTDFIDFGIWAGLAPLKVEQWLNNFKGETEEYFAHRLLDNLIFRSEDQVKSMLKQLFQHTLTNLAVKHLTFVPKDVSDFSEYIKNNGWQYVNLVVAVKPGDPPYKSAPAISRLIKNYFGGEDIGRAIIWPKDIPEARNKGVKCFIFIDDILGSGTQFDQILIDNNLTTWASDETFMYVPLTAHVNGKKFLVEPDPQTRKTKYPRLIIEAVEWLTEKNQAFREASGFFKDGTNTHENAKEFYLSLLKKYGIAAASPTGYGDLELCYIFAHAIPDNCLPILWSGQNGWKPIFDR